MKFDPHEFREAFPGLFFLDPADAGPLERYLRERGVLSAADSLAAVTRAGDGNMNCTVRAVATQRSVIVKQARPWVEKYPQFAAPWDRAAREAEFYGLVAGCRALAKVMPRLLDFDPEARVLILEDLGVASDYTGLYRGATITPEELEWLGDYLSRLHREFHPGSSPAALANREMRALNHAHIFEIPLAANHGLDLDALTPGLAEVAGGLQADAEFCGEVRRLGREVYLADGPSLVQGDFFPGSILRTPGGPRVIDPEFAFFGRPEFDVAVFLAHLLLANQSEAAIQFWLRAYRGPADYDELLMLKLAGTEIMRRLLGYAQLPVGYGLRRKQDLLRLAQELVLQPCPTLLTRIAAG